VITVNVQHPHATDIDGRPAPSAVTIPGHGNLAVNDGYLKDLDEAVAGRAMKTLAGAYDVAYTDEGDVVREADETRDDTDGDGAAIDEDSGTSDGEKTYMPAFDPGEFSVAELRDELDNRDLTDDELVTLLSAEDTNKDRKTAKEAIRSRIDAREE
jgi:hypothetical protein